MHATLAKLVGKPAFANYHDHVRTSAKAAAKLTAFLNRAGSHPAAIAEAAQAFQAKPTDENFARWVRAEAERAAMHAVAQQLSAALSMRRSDALADGGPQKLRAAAEEAMGELDAREAELRERAETSAAEFGAEMNVDAGLAEIERLRNKLRQAVAFADSDFNQAHSALVTVIGSAE